MTKIAVQRDELLRDSQSMPRHPVPAMSPAAVLERAGLLPGDSALFSDCLAHALRLTDSAVGFLHEISEDQSQIRLVSARGLALQPSMIVNSWQQMPAVASSWTTAVRGRKPVTYSEQGGEELFHIPGLQLGHPPLTRLLIAPVALGSEVRYLLCVAERSEGYRSIEVRDIVLVTNELRKILMQRQVEVALRESENRYRNLIVNLQIGVVAHAPDTSIAVSNPMASQLLGLTPDQMRGKTAIDPAWCFIHEDGRRAALEDYPVMQALRSDLPIRNLVLGILRPDRPGPTWVHCEAHKVLDACGSLQQIVVTFFDVTARKQAEEAVQERERRLQSILDNSNMMVWLKDLQGRLVMVNRRFEEACRINREDAIGKTAHDLFPADVAERMERDDRQVLASGTSTQFEEPGRGGACGHTFVTTKFPLFGADSKPYALCGIVADLSRQLRQDGPARADAEPCCNG